MCRFWRIAGIATFIVVVGVAAVGAAALAQEDDGTAIWPFNFGERLHEAIASALGMTVDQYDEAIGTARSQVLDQAVDEGWLTEDQADRMRERLEAMPDRSWLPHALPLARGGQGMGGLRGGWRRGLLDSALSVAADELGMTPRDLWAELQDGKSVADVATERGVDLQVIVDAYLARATQRLNRAVENGNLTQERADWMIAQAETRIPALLQGSWKGCGGGGFHRGMRPSCLQSYPSRSDA